MPRSANTELPLLDMLLDDDLAQEQKHELIRAIRSADSDAGQRLDSFLLTHLVKARAGLEDAQMKMKELGAMIANLTQVPWHAAIFVCPVDGQEDRRAIVLHGSGQHLVGLRDGFTDELNTGDEVFLSNSANVIMAKSPRGVPPGGETAFFDRKAADGRLVLKSRDEELIAYATPALSSTELKKGDIVRFDRSLWIAFEKIEHARGHQCLLEEVPETGRQQIGGQDANIETLFSALTMSLTDPARAARYGLSGRQSVLMIGPPGCGKTLMAKAAASEVMRASGTKCRVAVVKPAEWESPWVGETQANIRHFFKSLREAANEGFVVAFLDEIEAVGRIRGSAVGHYSDKFLAALLAELDGFVDRRNVAIIAATNRKDLVDPALLQRLSDIEIHVGRPNLSGARKIFGIHLPPTLPFSPNGAVARATREELIEAAVSRFYSPNADNAVCVIRFRDGKERTVVARELASGRIFEQVCRAACRTACLREQRGEGEPGLRTADIDDAVAQAIERMRTMLSIENAHSYLSDLPGDIVGSQRRAGRPQSETAESLPQPMNMNIPKLCGADIELCNFFTGSHRRRAPAFGRRLRLSMRSTGCLSTDAAPPVW